MAQESLPGLRKMRDDWNVFDESTLQQLIGISQSTDKKLRSGMLAWNVYSLATWYKRWFM